MENWGGELGLRERKAYEHRSLSRESRRRNLGEETYIELGAEDLSCRS